ncbi:hypothetical protein Hanom_Chr07g00653531 [Helianthus anomalus]
MLKHETLTLILHSSHMMSLAVSGETISTWNMILDSPVFGQKNLDCQKSM